MSFQWSLNRRIVYLCLLCVLSGRCILQRKIPVIHNFCIGPKFAHQITNNYKCSVTYDMRVFPLMSKDFKLCDDHLRGTSHRVITAAIFDELTLVTLPASLIGDMATWIWTKIIDCLLCMNFISGSCMIIEWNIGNMHYKHSSDRWSDAAIHCRYSQRAA